MKRLTLTLLIIFTFFLSTDAWSVTYYVDYVGGLDTNNGTSPFTPFKHCPGDDRATNTTASTTLSAGDRVIFKGGVEYKGTTGTSIIQVKWSGSGDADENRIIYDGDSGSYALRWANGTAKAIIDGDNTSTYLFYFPGARPYITINNFVMRNGREASGGPGYSGIFVGNFTNGSDYVNISNCDMSDPGIITQPAQSGYCIYNIYGDHWTLNNNKFTDCGNLGVNFHTASYTKIHHNTFTGRAIWLLGLQVQADNAVTDNEIYNNTFYDHYMGYPGGYEAGHGNWIHIFSGTNTSGMGDSTCTLSNTRIYNNVFYYSYPVTYTTNYSVGFLQIAYYTNQNNDGIYIYNNVFFNPEHVGITLTARNDIVDGEPLNGKIKNVYILNNTFYSNVSSIDGFRLCNSAENPDNMSNINIENNIIYSLRWVLTAPLEDDLVDETIDYNNYYGTFSTPFRQYNCTAGGGSSNWTTWQGLGHDTNGYFQNPLFVDPTVSHNFNLRLSSTSSPAYKTGINLSSLCSNPNLANLCYDITGMPRSQSGAWDMGAYEYINTETQAPKPPSNLRIIQ